MDLDKLNFLPYWEEVHFHKDETETETWLYDGKLEPAKALYNQWRENTKKAALRTAFFSC